MLLTIGHFASRDDGAYRLCWAGQVGQVPVKLRYPADRRFFEWKDPLIVELEAGVAFLGGCAYAGLAETVPVDADTLRAWGDAFCRTGATDFLASIDGSFTVILIDSRRGSLLAATDLRSVVPIYYWADADRLALSWSVSALREATGIRPAVSLGSLLSAVCNGMPVGRHTYHRGISRLGPGQTLSWQAGKSRVHAYFQRTAGDHDRVSHAEFADCLQAAVRTELARGQGRAALALSGGIDSRCLLAAILRSDWKPEALTWGADRLELPFGDYQAGRKLAEHAGLVHHAIPLDPDQLPGQLEPIVRRTDGLVLHVAGFSGGESFLRELARSYGAILFGCHCLGNYSRRPTLRGVLLASGLRTGLYLRAAARFLRPEHRAEAVEEYRAQVDELLSPFRGWPVQAIECQLDFLQIAPRMEAAQHWVWMKYLYPSCPLMTRSVLEFSNRLSLRQRADKAFFTQTVQDHLWPGAPWPTNTKNSRIHWEARMENPGPLARGLANLVTAPGAFFEYFDRNQILDWLRFTMPKAPPPETGAPGFTNRLVNLLYWRRTHPVQLAYLAVLRQRD